MGKAESGFDYFFLSLKYFFHLKYFKKSEKKKIFFFKKKHEIRQIVFECFFSWSVIPIAKMLCSLNLSTAKPEEKFNPNLLMFDPIKHLVLLLGLPVGVPVSGIFDRRIFQVKVCSGEFDGGYQLFPWVQNNGV